MHLLRKQFEEVVSLTDEEFKYILSHFEEVEIKKGKTLIALGNKVNDDWFLLEGYLKAFEIDKLGKKRIIQLATSNMWISDYWSYINRKPATLFINCLFDAKMLAISIDNREKLCAEMHKVERFYNIKANNGYIELQQRVLSLLGDTAKEKYDKFAQLYPDFNDKLPKSLIASYLGVSRETLSRMY